jgi:hypothetical protein
MSAGGLSYHGIIGHTAKATLPSVDSWGTDMNILRDPPKMIMTRKVDKVGETSSITQMKQESGDRACEAINVYARGVNPFVAVSYQNYGNNGGQRVNGFSSKRGGNLAGRQARKPYGLGPEGSFRPPVQPPQNLLPLSRLPRVTTSSFTQPGFADFSKKAMCPQSGDCTVGVKKQSSMLRTCVRPTATYQMETPIRENFEVKYVIKNPTKITGHSGMRTRDLTEQHVGVPVKTLIENPMHVDVNPNVSSVHYVDSNHMNPERYLQDALNTSAHTNLSQNVQLIPIEDLVNVDIHIKDPVNISYAAPLKGHEKHEYIQTDHELDRPVPAHTATTNRRRRDNYVHPHSSSYRQQLERNRPMAYGTTNMASTRRNVDNISSRDYHLKPTITAGSFAGKGSAIPGRYTMDSSAPERENLRQSINRKVMDMQQGRYSR